MVNKSIDGPGEISREMSLDNIFYPRSQGEQNKQIEKGTI